MDKDPRQKSEEALHKTKESASLSPMRKRKSLAQNLDKLATPPTSALKSQSLPNLVLFDLQQTAQANNPPNIEINSNEIRFPSAQSTPGFGPIPAPNNNLDVEMLATQLVEEQLSSNTPSKNIVDANTLAEQLEKMQLSSDTASKNTILNAFEQNHSKEKSSGSLVFGNGNKVFQI